MQTSVAGITLIIALTLNAKAYAQATDVDCSGCVDSGDIAGGGVTTSDIAAGAVTTGKIDNRAVTTSKIGTRQVTTAKIKPRAVTTSRIKDGAVTVDKVEPALKNSIGTFCPPGESAVGMDETGNFACESIGGAGIAVRVDGTIVGRFIESGSGFLEVAATSGGTEFVAEALAIANTRVIFATSSTGYFFDLHTADNDHPFLTEGNLGNGRRYFETTDCTGNAYRVIEGDTGFFSVFQPGTGRLRPIKPWFARQGWVFSSPDPNDVTSVWMVRRGATPQTAALGSFLVFARALGTPFCVEFSNLDGYDINNPLHVNHTVVPAEPNDPAVTGITGILGGEVTVGL
jgi:hypothetical protein